MGFENVVGAGRVSAPILAIRLCQHNTKKASRKSHAKMVHMVFRVELKLLNDHIKCTLHGVEAVKYYISFVRLCHKRGVSVDQAPQMRGSTALRYDAHALSQAASDPSHFPLDLTSQSW